MRKNERKKSRREQGYTLLEYCAGAAIIIGVVWGALNTLGGNMAALIGNIATWASDRGQDIKDGNVGIAAGGAATGAPGNGGGSGSGNGG